MAEQVVKKPQRMVEEIVSEETDTRLETSSAVWKQRINLELTRRKVRKTEKRISKNGSEQRKLEFDEDTERSLVSYPSPSRIYREEADQISTEIQKDEQKEESGVETVSIPQLFLMKLDVSEPSGGVEVAEISTSAEELGPTTKVVEKEKTRDQGFKVEEVKEFSFQVETGRTPVVEDEQAKASSYDTEGRAYEEEDTVEFSPPVLALETPFSPELEVEDEYPGAVLEPEISSLGEDYGRFSSLLEDFQSLEEYESKGEAVFHAEYGGESEISERLVMDLDAMFPYRDSVSGSEAVEALWSEYGVEATIGEVPYFSENSGESWEEGWNSFDMVVQMKGMSMLETEYLSGDLYDLGELEQPVQNSIEAQFDTDEAIEFRESKEFGGCNSSYEASEKTKNAWAEKYGEEILELDSMERGIYAAFKEGESFRGAPMEPGETELLSDSAIEML
jgi:hypothetical protein